MSGDLLTLRMMVVSAAAAVREQWREGAALASIPIEFSGCDVAGALRAFKAGAFDVVVVDATLPVDQRNSTLAAAHALRPRPLIAVSGTPAPQGETVDVALPSADREEVRSLVEHCIRLRLPKRVLIVDDSRTMRSIVRKILSASRFTLEITEAEEGVAALKMLADGYDLVLLDYNMPGLDGVKTLAEIKRIAPGVAVVMMTSSEDEAVAGRAQESGAIAFLKKPFYPADIDAVFARVYTGSK